MHLSTFSLVLLLAVSLGLASPSGLSEVTLEQGSCPPFWYSFNNSRCYKYVSSHLTWADAELFCVSQRANLVSIHSLEENNFVRSLMHYVDRQEVHAWIGLSDNHKERWWMWSDGCPVNYVSWDFREPNNAGGNEHCAEIYGAKQKWNDRPCSETHPSICATRLSECPA